MSVVYEGEQGYLNLLREIVEDEGLPWRETRNGRTRGLFARHLRFDLRNGFPLLTTKRVFFRGIVAELLWFLRGQTDSHLLRDQGVHIWDDNSSREFLDARGLAEYPEGECGPIYGHQWRHWNRPFGAKEGGIDQISEVVRLLRTDPMSRRILFHAWNPEQLEEMSLPPCHLMYQFYVEEGQAGNRLSCMMTQRSADLFLGVPFNIASTALLVHLLARTVGMEVGTITLNLGDAHVYEEHFEACRKQISRVPGPLPSLELAETGPGLPVSEHGWDDTGLSRWRSSDISVKDYVPQGSLKAQMKA